MTKLSIRPIVAGISILFASATPLHAEQQNHRQHGAHEHGSARLMLAIEGNELEMELISPAMNLVGFEHQPANPQQRKAVYQAIDTLKAADRLFILPKPATCTLQKVEVETGLAADGHGHGHDENRQGKASHAEFHAHYHFRCNNIAELKQIDVQLFSHFPATHELDVEMITGSGQKAVELNHDHHKLTL